MDPFFDNRISDQQMRVISFLKWQKTAKIPKKSQKITVKNNMKKNTHPFECLPE